MRLKLRLFLRRHSFPASADRSSRDRLETTFSQRSVRSLCAQHDVSVLLCVCYLENHVFLGTRIDRKISARHVFYRRCTTASLFQLCNTEQFLHRCSWSRVIGTKTFNPHSTLIMMPRNTGIGSPSCTHPRALVGTIQASS